MRPNPEEKSLPSDEKSHIFAGLIGSVLALYAFLLVGVLPLYSSDGYRQIGTDKAEIFARFADPLAKTLLVLGGMYVIWTFLSRAVISVPSLFGHFAGHTRKRLHVGEEDSNLLDQAKKQENKSKQKQFDWSLCSLLFAIGYAAVIAVSFGCSKYQADTFWGCAGWYLGFWPQEIALLFGIATALFLRKNALAAWKQNPLAMFIQKCLAFTGVGVSLFVFLLGVLNRFGLYFLGFSRKDPSKLATIGNMNWYCGYLVPFFFGAVGILILLLPKWKWSRAQIFLLLYLAIAGSSLLSQGSASGILALFLLLFGMGMLDAFREKRDCLYLLFLLGCCGSFLYFLQLCGLSYNDIRPENQLLTGTPWILVGTAVLGLFLLRKLGMPGKLGKQGKKAGLLGKSGKRQPFSAQAKKRIAVTFFCVCIGIGIFLLALLIGNTLSEGALLQHSILENLGKKPGDLLYFGPHWGSNRGATWTIALTIFREQDLTHRFFGIGPDAFSYYLSREAGLRLQVAVLETFGMQRLTNAHCELLTILVNHGIAGAFCFAGMMGSALIALFQKGCMRKNGIAFVCGMSLMGYLINQLFSFETIVNFPLILLVWGVGVGVHERNSNCQNDGASQ